MPQNNTDTADGVEITPTQQQVLEHLMVGRTVTDAAKASGVDRTTVHRWLRADYFFQAMYNRTRREHWDATQIKLKSLGQEAIKALEAALAKGDARSALEVLKGLGFLDGKPAYFGAVDPETLRESAERAKAGAENLKKLLDDLSGL